MRDFLPIVFTFLLLHHGLEDDRTYMYRGNNVAVIRKKQLACKRARNPLLNFLPRKRVKYSPSRYLGKDETGQLALISYRNEHGELVLQIANRDQLRDRHWLEVTTPDSPSPHPRDRRTEIILAGLILGKTWEEILVQLHKEGHEA